MKVFVRNNDVQRAARDLRKRFQRERLVRKMKDDRFYIKPSEEKAMRKKMAFRRVRKILSRRMQKDGY